jgi:hypothetical protein
MTAASRLHDRACAVARHVSDCCGGPAVPDHASSSSSTTIMGIETRTVNSKDDVAADGALPFFSLFRLRWRSASITRQRGVIEQHSSAASDILQHTQQQQQQQMLDEAIGEWCDFDEEVLARRYRALALLLHPDRWIRPSPQPTAVAATATSGHGEDITTARSSEEEVQPTAAAAITVGHGEDVTIARSTVGEVPSSPSLGDGADAITTTSSSYSPRSGDFANDNDERASDHYQFLAGAFSSMQSAYHVLRDAGQRAQYVARGHDVFCQLERDPTLRQRQWAHVMAAAMTLFSGGGGGSTQQPVEGCEQPPPPLSLSSPCAATSPSPSCARFVLMEGSTCSACRQAQLLAAAKKPLASQSTRCSTFGCLRTLTKSSEDVSSGCCTYCRNKPKKCGALGCFAMVAPTSTSLEAQSKPVLCQKHQNLV